MALISAEIHSMLFDFGRPLVEEPYIGSGIPTRNEVVASLASQYRGSDSSGLERQQTGQCHTNRNVEV